MNYHQLWTDDLWPLLIQTYMRKPIGVKPLYSRHMVKLALELHIPPKDLQTAMRDLETAASPSTAALMATYGKDRRKLDKAAARVRRARAFGTGGAFFDGVETVETFERQFRVIDGHEPLTPVMLTLTLDLYFRLTPATMVAETPEVRDLAALMGVKPATVARVMEAFQVCDPYLKRKTTADGTLENVCREVWNTYANDIQEALADTAAQLAEYFKKPRKK